MSLIKNPSIIAGTIAAFGMICGIVFGIHAYNLRHAQPVEVPILVSFPCTPNRYGTPEQIECAAYLSQEPVSIFRAGFSLFGDDSPIPVRQLYHESNQWIAELRPGDYLVNPAPTKDFLLKSMTAGAADLTIPNAVYSLHSGVAPDIIRIAYVKAAAVEGATFRNGQPVAARVFVMSDALMASAPSVLRQTGLEHGHYLYRLDGFEAGNYRFCAIDIKDIDRYHIDYTDHAALNSWCKKPKALTLAAGATVHLDLETSRAADP